VKKNMSSMGLETWKSRTLSLKCNVFVSYNADHQLFKSIMEEH
jgi:hypothetical protein